MATIGCNSSIVVVAWQQDGRWDAVKWKYNIPAVGFSFQLVRHPWLVQLFLLAPLHPSRVVVLFALFLPCISHALLERPPRTPFVHREPTLVLFLVLLPPLLLSRVITPIQSFISFPHSRDLTLLLLFFFEARGYATEANAGQIR